MVKEIKEAGKQTGLKISNAFEVVMLAATTAVAIYTANAEYVNGYPVWQIASGLVLAGVAYKLYRLQSSK
jgi:hypothetical protein